ncbi:MAG TPA: MFS transporter [Solirubrobacteraceae bacterium]|jgi:EmrB/QacA subfamily drug resistance transporter|nr:MFS transporter [Solirubrobacteraceae bacterium]
MVSFSVAATTTATAATSEPPIDRKTVLALVAMGVAVFIIANDFTALAVALPAIEKQFNTDVGTAQWVINAYALTFGVLIVVGGRLADIFGRKRIFIIGAAIFAAFSVLGGVAQSTAWLISCRALMGIGGAMMWPAILGMTFAALPESRAGLAGGLILGAAGIGNAVGPMFGGVLTEALSWRWIFFVNVPIAAFGVLATWLAIHQTEPEPADKRIDYAGVATLSLGLVSLLVALDQVTDWGWGDVRIVVLLVLCAAMLIGFGFVERRMDEGALIPRDVIGNRDFSTACLAVLLMSAVFFASLLYLPQFMQKILGYSPLKSGVGLVPMMGMFALTSFIAGPLYGKLGAKLIVSLGCAAISVGILLLSLVGRNSGYGGLVAGMLVLGVGIGLFYSSITTASVTALDPARAGLAGGIVYMFQIAGGSVGLGLNTTIFTSSSKSDLNSHLSTLGAKVSETQSDLVHGILAGTASGKQVLSQFSSGVAQRLSSLVRDAFVAGLHTAFRLDTALAICALLVAVLFVGGTQRKQPEST